MVAQKLLDESGYSVPDMTPYRHKNTILHTCNELKFDL